MNVSPFNCEIFAYYTVKRIVPNSWKVYEWKLEELIEIRRLDIYFE